MAITLSKSLPLNAVRVIAEKDDALDPKSDYQAYKSTLDDSKLVLLPGKSPTVFLCNFKLDSKQAKLIKNAMMQNGEDGKPAIGFGSWTMTLVKLTLKDIQNPDYVPQEDRLVFKKDGAGYVHDDLLAQLEEYGIVSDIFSFFITLTEKKTAAATTKN